LRERIDGDLNVFGNKRPLTLTNRQANAVKKGVERGFTIFDRGLDEGQVIAQKLVFSMASLCGSTLYGSPPSSAICQGLVSCVAFGLAIIASSSTSRRLVFDAFS
jgi:hypothetical protein